MNQAFAMSARGGGGHASSRTAGVAAGSVWETRMLNDQVMGGIKLYAAGDAEETKREVEEEEDAGVPNENLMVRPACAGGTALERRKRRTWLPPDPDGRTLSDILRGAPMPAQENATAVEKELDTPRTRTWVVEEIKQVDRVREVIAHPSVETKPLAPPEEPLEFPSVRHTGVEMVKKSTAMQLERVDDSTSAANSKRIQTFVDVLMWVDVSRTAFAFGVGAFLLFCSSYAKQLDFSVISGVSFLGLLNLAVVFIYKSIIRRELDPDENDQNWWIGEEEAISFTKMALPYMNKLLGKFRTLFSGDPATTMKLATILFFLARYGGQITLWTMAKLAFLGAFTIPRLCRSRSTALSTCGKAWLDRPRHMWESCSHKKALFGILFLLLWNLSSMAVRIWAGFMLLVVLRYYQQQQRRLQHRKVADSHSDSEDNSATTKKQQLTGQRPSGNVIAPSPPPLAEAAASGRHRPRRQGTPLSSSLRQVEAASGKLTRRRA